MQYHIRKGSQQVRQDARYQLFDKPKRFESIQPYRVDNSQSLVHIGLKNALNANMDKSKRNTAVDLGHHAKSAKHLQARVKKNLKH